MKKLNKSYLVTILLNIVLFYMPACGMELSTKKSVPTSKEKQIEKQQRLLNIITEPSFALLDQQRERLGNYIATLPPNNPKRRQYQNKLAIIQKKIEKRRKAMIAENIGTRNLIIDPKHFKNLADQIIEQKALQKKDPTNTNTQEKIEKYIKQIDADTAKLVTNIILHKDIFFSLSDQEWTDLNKIITSYFFYEETENKRNKILKPYALRVRMALRAINRPVITENTSKEKDDQKKQPAAPKITIEAPKEIKLNQSTQTTVETKTKLRSSDQTSSSTAASLKISVRPVENPQPVQPATFWQNITNRTSTLWNTMKHSIISIFNTFKSWLNI